MKPKYKVGDRVILGCRSCEDVSPKTRHLIGKVGIVKKVFTEHNDSPHYVIEIDGGNLKSNIYYADKYFKKSRHITFNFG